MLREDRLKEYREKRDFSRTPEPSAKRGRKAGRKLRYLIQKHAARREHFDFRLEYDGALLSWAVPKGPSYDTTDKRLAVRTEDHPLAYGDFEGTIPEGEYGAGTVMLWDRGYWRPDGDVADGLEKGKLAFELFGKRLKGHWALVRLRARKKERGKQNWLLIKERDEYAGPEKRPVVEREKKSVKSGRTMEQIARGRKVWHSNREKKSEGAPAARTQERKPKKKRKAKSDAELPRFVPPQLTTLVDAPPPGDEWVHEIKYDGYRAITAVAGDRVRIFTRKGLDWTDKFAPLVEPLAELPCDSALLDGEIAIADKEGHTNFGALQEAISEGRGAFGYYLFDLLEIDGEDLRKRPLLERKKRLRDLLRDAPKNGPLFYSDHIEGHGEQAFSHACDLKLEGIISKQANASYRSGRTRSWLKSKCGNEQELVIIGWTPSDKKARPFRSMLVAVNEEGRLRYAGRVGTGFDEETLDRLATLFKRHARRTSPAEGVPPAIARKAHFIEPKLVGEFAFRGWTGDELVRQASFKGLRADKPAREIVREEPMTTKKSRSRKQTTRKTAKAKEAKVSRARPTSIREEEDEIEGVRITHPDRVFYPDHDITKRDLIEYYRKVAKWILPHAAGRPLALVRCPRGVDGERFFQKHASQGWPDEFRKIRIREKSGTDEYLYIEDVSGLVAAAQMSVLELHLWGSKTDDVEKPDRLVFDLDPDEHIPFRAVKDAARDLRARLQRVGLKSFPMATGGKGIHVVVPLVRGHSWDEHRNFAEAMARVMAEEAPDRYVANMSKARRRGKIFIDYLRNQRGSTAIAPYSSRARKGATIALPLSWPQLARLKNAQPARIGKFTPPKSDPWAGYFKMRQRLPYNQSRH